MLATTLLTLGSVPTLTGRYSCGGGSGDPLGDPAGLSLGEGDGEGPAEDEEAEDSATLTVAGTALIGGCGGKANRRGKRRADLQRGGEVAGGAGRAGVDLCSHKQHRVACERGHAVCPAALFSLLCSALRLLLALLVPLRVLRSQVHAVAGEGQARCWERKPRASMRRGGQQQQEHGTSAGLCSAPCPG